jgi:hypothetical protein
MKNKNVSYFVRGDTVYMFGGRPGGATGVVEAKVKKIGRSYLFTTLPEDFEDKDGREWRFDRNTGLEVVESNYKRKLVIDRDAFYLAQKTHVAYSNLRQAMAGKLPEGVTLADIEAAAKLLRFEI